MKTGAKVATGTILGLVFGGGIGSGITYFVMKKKMDEAIKIQLLRNDELCRQLHPVVIENAGNEQNTGSEGHSGVVKPAKTEKPMGIVGVQGIMGKPGVDGPSIVKKPLGERSPKTADDYFKYDKIIEDYVKEDKALTEGVELELNKHNVAEEMQCPPEDGNDEPLVVRYTAVDSTGSTPWNYINTDEGKLLLDEASYWDMSETSDYQVDDDKKYVLSNLVYFKDGTIARNTDLKPLVAEEDMNRMIGDDNLRTIKSLFADRDYIILYVRNLNTSVDYEIEYIDEDYETYTA